MKKTILYIVWLICLLILIPNLYAQLEIDRIRAYVNNERVSGVDEDGGDIDVNQDDTLELVIELQNDENTTTQVRLKGTIENIDDDEDIVKEHDWFDISADDYKSKTLSFHVPVDANADDYDFELEIFYKFSNGTERKYEINYDVIVEKIVEEEEEIDLEKSFNNLTIVCTEIVGTMDTCFGYIGRHDNCTGELSTCEQERGEYNSDYDDCNTDLTDCNTERTGLKTEKQNLDNQLKNRPTWAKCINDTNTKVAEAESARDNTYLMFGAVGIILWLFYTKRKKKETVSDTFYYGKE